MTDTTATSEAAPLAGARLASLDFTRGVAVAGILLANIVGFGQPLLAYMWPGGFLTAPEPSDKWLWLAQFVLVDGKLRGLFTLLFGAGMVLFMDRAWARGQTRALQTRRLLILLLFGLAHYFLLWRGDILTGYAICGLAALWALRWPAHAQMSVGVIGYALGAIAQSFAHWMLWAATNGPLAGRADYAGVRAAAASMLSSERADAAAETALIIHGNWADLVAHSFAHHRWDWLIGLESGWTETLPLMLIGMALYRFGLFDGRIDPREQRRWGWIGLMAGAAATLALGLWAVAEGLTYTGTLFAFLGPQAFARLPMVIALAALLALWGPRATGWLGSRFAAAGRMAFSNYLGTSLAMVLVFHQAALFGTLDRPRLYLVALLGCAVMLAWSKPWLARFRYGPLEWLWRCLTYGKRFPFRR